MPKNNKPAKQAKAKAKAKPSTTVNKPKTVTVDAPAARGFDFQTFFRETRLQRKDKDGNLRDAICVEGREYIGPVQVPADEVAGSVYSEFYLSPGEFAGTRLSLYARLYEKFLFEVMDFEYIPGIGSESAGSIILAHDRDISDATPPATQQGVRQFLSMEDSRGGNVWMNHRIRCPLRSKEDGFFTNPVIGGDDRLAYQGQMYVSCLIPTGLAEGTAIGSLVMHYKCMFFVPQLENELSQLQSVSVGTYNIATASPAASYDLLKAAALNPTATGVLQYLPVLQADGTWAIKLPEGLYDYAASIIGGTQDTTGVTPNGQIETSYPTLEALEPMAAPAPQPQVEMITVTGEAGTGESIVNWTETNTIDRYLTNVVQRAYLSVPRGGALLRHVLEALLVSGSTAVWQSPNVGLSLTKLGGSVQSLLNYVPQPSPIQVREAQALGLLDSKSKQVSLFTLRVLVRRFVKAEAGRGNASVPIPKSLRSLVEGAKSMELPNSPPNKEVMPALKSASVVVTGGGNASGGSATALSITASSPSAGLQKCKYCAQDKPDHLGRDCPKKVCSVCGKNAPGHNSCDCPLKGERSDLLGACFACGKSIATTAEVSLGICRECVRRRIVRLEDDGAARRSTAT